MIHIFMHASQKPPSEKSYSFIKFCNIVNILYFSVDKHPAGVLQ